ncbi:MAG: hypothetical protein RR740_00485 [Pseudomonas sp.]
MDIFQDIDGQGLNRKGWEKRKDSPEWTVKEYRNKKIWVRLHWVGKYDKKLPAEYRHSHGIQVYNRVVVRGSEWDEDLMDDRGWLIDHAATETFRTLSAATSAYEDMLLQYTKSYIDEDENGDMVLVEEENELKKAEPGKMELSEEQIAAAAEKGVDAGGWS